MITYTNALTFYKQHDPYTTLVTLYGEGQVPERVWDLVIPLIDELDILWEVSNVLICYCYEMTNGAMTDTFFKETALQWAQQELFKAEDAIKYIQIAKTPLVLVAN